MNIHTLIRILDRYLKWSKEWENPKQALDQAFGGLMIDAGPRMMTPMLRQSIPLKMKNDCAIFNPSL